MLYMSQADDQYDPMQIERNIVNIIVDLVTNGCTE